MFAKGKTAATNTAVLCWQEVKGWQKQIFFTNILQCLVPYIKDP